MKSLVGSLLAITVLWAPPVLTAQTSGSSADEAVLSPGDSVRITVWRKPEFSGDFVVAPDGSVTHPLFRSVRVGGVPIRTAEANVRAFLTRFEQDPQFVMEPLIRIAVSGEVPRPQVFAVPPGTSLAVAVARAGGTTQFARRNNVSVFRVTGSGRSEQLSIDLTRPDQGLAAAPVRSGDQIVVDRRKNFWRDIAFPVLGAIGSIASVAILIDRASNGR
jgi:polysaccharide export outer membrane protein